MVDPSCSMQKNDSFCSDHTPQNLLSDCVNSNFSYSSQFNVLQQGAEAILYEGMFLGRKCIVKERFSKKYRHPQLDSVLTKDRMKAEIKGITRCKLLGISTPTLFFIDNMKHRLYMEYIEDSVTVRELIKQTEVELKGLDKVDNLATSLELVSCRIGEIIGIMHQNNIVHGDLTTSNLLARRNPNGMDIIVIDFGLSCVSHNPEDKGVDLYVLERALLSTHPNSENFFASILLSYREQFQKAKAVLTKLDEIRQRGRKREMVG